MSAFDEQNEELEVLNSIYPTEITIFSSNPHKFKITICPNPGGDDNHVIAALLCELPENYPTSEAPLLNIEVVKGLSLDRGEELKAFADKIAVENIGLPSIFTVAEGVKEWLVDNNIPGQDGSMYSDMLRRMQQKEVETKKQSEKAAHKALADSEFREEEVDPEELERIRKRQAGTQVTMETFLQWKAAFDEEMRVKAEAAAAAALKAGGSASTVGLNDDRPSGKQLFLQNKANVDDAAVEALIVAGEAEEVTGEGEGDIDEDDDDEDDEDYVEGEGSDGEED